MITWGVLIDVWEGDGALILWLGDGTPAICGGCCGEDTKWPPLIGEAPVVMIIAGELT